MAKKSYAVVGLDGKSDAPIHASFQGCVVMVAVVIGYPGSKVSDLLIGDTKVQVPNSALRAAADLHDDLCDTEGG